MQHGLERRNEWFSGWLASDEGRTRAGLAFFIKSGRPIWVAVVCISLFVGFSAPHRT